MLSTISGQVTAELQRAFVKWRAKSWQGPFGGKRWDNAQRNCRVSDCKLRSALTHHVQGRHELARNVATETSNDTHVCALQQGPEPHRQQRKADIVQRLRHRSVHPMGQLGRQPVAVLEQRAECYLLPSLAQQRQLRGTGRSRSKWK